MNKLFFDNQMTTVIKSIDLTEQKLNSDQDFLDPVRKHFDRSLESLLHLLGQDASYRKYTGKNWDVAHHVVKFGSLYNRLERIREKIFTLKTPPYFTKKIERKVLPLLESRIKEVTQHLGSLEPLPFKKGQDRRQFLINVRKSLTPSLSDDTQHAEKEYFHLLGNSLDQQQVKTINISPYVNNLEIYSLSSWADVISAFIGEGDSSEAKMGNQILQMVKQATAIALKMNFIFKLPQIKTNDISKEKKYYKDLMKLKQAEENGKQLTTYQSTFLQTYSLAKKEDLPASVLINEITWAMLSSIQAMKTNEECIFPVGTREHSIIVQVTCLEQPSYLCRKGKYRYKVFNTGDGMQQFHYTEKQNGKLMVRPLIFHDLPQTVFSYSFLFELARLSLQSRNVEEFYALHDRAFVQEGGAKKDELSGAFHFTQEYGTCTYSSVEAWVNSYLTEDQIKHLELVKAKFSTSKQEKIVNFLEQKAKQAQLKNSTQQSNGSSAPPIKDQKLENGRLLLQLGKTHLQQVSQVFSKQTNTKGLGTQNAP